MQRIIHFISTHPSEMWPITKIDLNKVNKKNVFQKLQNYPHLQLQKTKISERKKNFWKRASLFHDPMCAEMSLFMTFFSSAICHDGRTYVHASW